ncbi:unnamed protein product [Vitrella brassicaformis CCMP3155]|uniref:Superoxide dismutase n=1 Tax=Vitrella brassicaformis (strain CCMP3155) TaxID=1169540 RepID=A0A0G4EVM8_VITBC|nr:unnamed protein product [Vitrella brassicaformis CCMP3155]|eukprot:CEM02146.1 unnamed protein product [Vitrella brassicaformis CCMP3155]
MSFLSSVPCAMADGDFYKLPDLPYDYGALEPSIDATTMQLHHDKHHATYVKKLNDALKEKKPRATNLADLQAEAMKLGSTVRNNGGGAYNHALFWRMMAPVGKGGEPSEALQKAINAVWGSKEGFQEAFSKAATAVFGSGWAWLIVKKGGLEITTTPNQDNNLMISGSGIPILGIDVWEHAYYLKYNNRRPDYVKEWWKVVNWSEVNNNYENYALKGIPVPA